MAEVQIICIGCPKGCKVTLAHDDENNILSVSGYGCKNGEEYAKNEFTAPVRIFTSTVKVTGGDLPLVPVKTKGAVPKSMLMECAKESCKIEVSAPVKIGDVIKSDLCGTGVDLVAARNIKQL
jgi:CxxC motif-containing protein